MKTSPPPDELKANTSPVQLFRKTAELEIAGHRFVVRRMSLAEELEWYGLRDRIMADDGLTDVEKVVRVWESLLQRVVVEPRLQSYVEELPAPAVAHLIQTITELHLWNTDFRKSSQASG
ncbi:MAG: hypothetical protein QXV97_04370 [Candidatus Caldarchaeum sp.]